MADLFDLSPQDVTPAELNRYGQLIEKIFLDCYTPGAEQVEFERIDLEKTADALQIKLPKNLGDVIYSFRYRTPLPASIQQRAPEGKQWVIQPAGRSRFEARAETWIKPDPLLAETKIPDATPGIVQMYALDDEQALLTKLRYNRLIDIFMGVTCYSLQNHLRTVVPGIGQVETHELYVGIDQRGAQYVFPVQAKGGSDLLGLPQIEQDLALGTHRFPQLICRAIAAQFMGDNLIALMAFEMTAEGAKKVAEKHYRLTPHQSLTPEDLAGYKARPSSA